MKNFVEKLSTGGDSASTVGPAPPVLGAIWFALVAISVVGRLWQPAFNVTPLTGAAIAAGVVFPNPLAAASVPIAALAVSNLALDGYGPGIAGVVMSVVVYAALTWPVLLGVVVRRSRGGAAGRFVRLLGSGLASSLVFFLATNVAHWCLTDDYPKSAAGLTSCLLAGLPFYRWMPVGDLAWTAALVGGLSFLGVVAPVSRPVFSPPANAA